MSQTKTSTTTTTQAILDENGNIVGNNTPYAYLLEQPAKCGVRFRYECEGRIASAIPGSHSSVSYNSWPTLAVANYHGPIKVIVSCVTATEPYRPHPHNLVGRKHCHDGIGEFCFPDASFCQFTDLGIVCAKRKDIRERLRVRECLHVNPFKTKCLRAEQQDGKKFDLTTIRLAFEVYILDPKTDKLSLALQPIVSNEIYDKKAMSDLTIYRLSHTSAPVSGGQTAIMLCDRINKEDIQIRFYLYGGVGAGPTCLATAATAAADTLLWEQYATFQGEDVHKHFAITFVIPEFPVSLIDKIEVLRYGQNYFPVHVQLVRPSDGAFSEPMVFHYLCDEASRSPQLAMLKAENPSADVCPSTTTTTTTHHHHTNHVQTNECYLLNNYFYPPFQGDVSDVWM